MATDYQRIKAIGDALVNGQATYAQLDKLGEALYAVDTAAWGALSQAEKLDSTIKKLRQWANYTIKQYELEQAAKTAANSVQDNSL